MENPIATYHFIDKIAQALKFAADKHQDQRRKGEKAPPYINHPIDVFYTLKVEGHVDDVDVLCAALLHDTVEDTEATIEEIEEVFGANIAQTVDEVSDDKTLSREERKRLQVEHVSQFSRGAQLLKLADKICNLRDIVKDPPKGWTEKRKDEYYIWAREVVDQIREANIGLAQIFDQEYEKRMGRNPIHRIEPQ